MIDKELNIVLKKMWSLKESIDSGEVLLEDDGQYWSDNIDTIKNYYKNNYIMWSNLWDYNNKTTKR